MNINSLKVINLETSNPTSSLTLVRNLEHSAEIPPEKYDLEPELEKYLKDLLSIKDIKILILGEADHKFVLFNTFEELKNGHLYFKTAMENWYWTRHRRRADTTGYPYEFRDRMAIPWSCVICMAIYLPAETSFYEISFLPRKNAREYHMWWMSYAGVKTFLPHLGGILRLNKKQTTNIFTKIMTD